MKTVSSSNFGLLIAYLAPGFTTLWAMSYWSETVKAWLGTTAPGPPTLGGFLYVTVYSVAAGVTVSAVRWALLDTLHHRTGIERPRPDFSKLGNSTAAFDVLIAIHYRYYEFFGGMLIAVAFLYLARRTSVGFWESGFGWIDIGFLALEWIFFAGSRDTLRKYYSRTGQLLKGKRSTSPLLFGQSLLKLFNKRRKRRTKRLADRS